MGSDSRAAGEANNIDNRLNKFERVAVKVCNYEVFTMFNARRLKMNRSAFSAFVVAAALGGSLYDATGQMINPTVQTASPRVAASRSAPATAGKPVASARVGPQVAPRPTGLNPQRFNESASHDRATTSQSAAHLCAARTDFESCFRRIKRAARWNGATTHFS